jgi:hypothetical protein
MIKLEVKPPSAAIKVTKVAIASLGASAMAASKTLNGPGSSMAGGFHQLTIPCHIATTIANAIRG